MYTKLANLFTSRSFNAHVFLCGNICYNKKYIILLGYTYTNNKNNKLILKLELQMSRVDPNLTRFGSTR